MKGSQILNSEFSLKSKTEIWEPIETNCESGSGEIGWKMVCSSEEVLLPRTEASLSVTVPRLFDSCWMWQLRVMARLGSLRLRVYCLCAASCQDKLFLLAGLSITGALSALGNRHGPAAPSWQVMYTVQRTSKRITHHEKSGLHEELNPSQTHTDKRSDWSGFESSSDTELRHNSTNNIPSIDIFPNRYRFIFQPKIWISKAVN